MKLLGLIDIFTAILLWGASAGEHIVWWLLVGFAAVLITKGLVGLGFATFIDVGSAILLIISIFAIPPWWIYLIFIILIAQKGIVSMFSF